MSERRYPWKYALFLMAYYVTNSVYQNYVTVYFKGIGLTTSQIGYLMGAVPLVSIFSQPLWGALGDRSGNRARLLRIMCVCAGAAVLAFGASSAFVWLLPLVCLFSAAYTAIQPMGDSIILEDLLGGRQPFGPLRLTACVSFAFSSVLFGRLLDNDMGLVLPLTAGMLALTFASTFCLPSLPGHQQKKERGASMLEILKLPNMKGLLILVTLLQLTMGYFYSFFPVHFTALPGASAGLLGTCYLISALSEVPFLLIADRLYDKIGVGRLLLVTALALSGRWLILGSTASVPLVMASQVLHGWGFIVMTVSMSKYINETVPDELKSRGQMLLAVVGFGLARVAGNLGGGLLGDALGIQGGFYVMLAISVGALAAFAPKYLRMKPLRG